MQPEQFVIPVMTVLHGHVSAETAYLVNDYPYGGLRCTMRYWCETAAKGQYKGHQRLVRQSENPKRGGWNKPHPETYSPLLVMYLDPEQQHRNGKDYVRALGYGPYMRPADLDHIHLCGAYDQLTTEQRQRFDALISVSQTADRHSWEKWAEWKTRVRDHLAGGNPIPAQAGGMVLGHYLWDADKYQILIASVLAEGRP